MVGVMALGDEAADVSRGGREGGRGGREESSKMSNSCSQEEGMEGGRAGKIRLKEGRAVGGEVGG